MHPALGGVDASPNLSRNSIMSGVRLLFTFFFTCCLVAVACGQASAQEQAGLERDALLTEPRNGAPVVTQLKQGISAEVIARKGVWVNLLTIPSGTCWMLSAPTGAASLFDRLLDTPNVDIAADVGGGGLPADPAQLLRGIFGR
jgi:hypothetical protein